ncbi:MAG TPA: GntR family transcriptional regulator [Anaerovoracaceae bacterium]|nr:GntR family transcriptional regulator [Anaerovoracaceae bacterium]
MENIEKLVWAPGNKIPTEQELCEQYNVSRITVRRALKALEDKSHIVRIPGKGTFVCEPKIEQPLGNFYSFSEQIERMNMIPSSRMYELRLIEAPPETAKLFGLDADNRVYFGIRLRLANNEPIAIEYFYLPAYLFPDLTAKEIEEYGLYNLMRTKYRVIPDEAEETFESILINNTEALLLNCEPDMPALRLERHTKANGVYVEDSKSVIRGDRYKYRVKLK